MGLKYVHNIAYFRPILIAAIPLKLGNILYFTHQIQNRQVNGDEKNPPYTADVAVLHDIDSSTEFNLLRRTIALQGFHSNICQR